MYVRTYVRTYVHTNTHICIYIYIYMYVCLVLPCVTIAFIECVRVCMRCVFKLG